MTKKWKVGAVYELADEQGFLEYVPENEQVLSYVSGKFKVLELDLYQGDTYDVTSIEKIDLGIQSSWPDGAFLIPEERKFFKRVKDY